MVIVQYTYGLPHHNANDEGLFGFVRVCAKETPTAGLSLLGRLLIPVSMTGTIDGTFTVRHVDETAADDAHRRSQRRQMIRFEEVQERILDQVQARIKPVANKAIEALADKATDPVANRRKRKPGWGVVGVVEGLLEERAYMSGLGTIRGDSGIELRRGETRRRMMPGDST